MPGGPAASVNQSYDYPSENAERVNPAWYFPGANLWLQLRTWVHLLRRYTVRHYRSDGRPPLFFCQFASLGWKSGPNGFMLGKPTTPQLKPGLFHLSPRLPRGRNWGVTIQISPVPNLSTEAIMSKSKVFFVLSLMVLLPTVAVFWGMVQVPFLNAGQNHLPAIDRQSAVVLTADGTDPQPKPSPFPWLAVAA